VSTVTKKGSKHSDNKQATKENKEKMQREEQQKAKS